MIDFNILRTQAPTYPFFELNISDFKAVVLASWDKFEKRDHFESFYRMKIFWKFFWVFKAILLNFIRIQGS